MRKALFLATALTTSVSFIPLQASAECIMGQIEWFAMNWVPQEYLPADGQILPIRQYSALYSLLGTTYGGDGRNTFALPDLRGRVPVGKGDGDGSNAHKIGEMLDTQNTPSNVMEMPAHQHDTGASSVLESIPPDAAEGQAGAWNGVKAVTHVAADAKTELTGASQPTPNMRPALVLTPAICVEGRYPSRH